MNTIQEEYAKALFQFALESGKINEVKTAYEAFLEAYDDGIRKFFLHPKVSKQEKKAVLTESIAEASFRYFLFLLVDNERMDLVRNCYYAFKAMTDRIQDVKRAFIHVKEKLSAKQERELAAELERRFKHKIEIEIRIDPKIISGIMIEIDSLVIDETANRRLAELKNILKQD